MVRAPYIDRSTGLRRGAWSEEEDNKLRTFVLTCGHRNWRQLPRLAGLARCGKSCRLRWMNYLKPGTRRGNFSSKEDELILSLYKEFGTKWAFIASKLPGRTDNDIKNHWHSNLWKHGVKYIPKTTAAAGETPEIHNGESESEDNLSDSLDSSYSSGKSADEIMDPLIDDICSPDWQILTEVLSPLEEVIRNPFPSYHYTNMDTFLLHHHQQQQLSPLMEQEGSDQVVCPIVEEDAYGIIWLDDLF